VESFYVWYIKAVDIFYIQIDSFFAEAVLHKVVGFILEYMTVPVGRESGAGIIVRRHKSQAEPSGVAMSLTDGQSVSSWTTGSGMN
jgi:hypothetical protein